MKYAGLLMDNVPSLHDLVKCLVYEKTEKRKEKKRKIPILCFILTFVSEN